MKMMMLQMKLLRMKENLLKPELVERGGLEPRHWWIHSHTLLLITMMMRRRITMILWMMRGPENITLNMHKCNKTTDFEVCKSAICKQILISRSVEFAASQKWSNRLD